MERSLLPEGAAVAASVSGSASTTLHSASASSASAREPGNELSENFVTHKVSKHDTLAGIAVKYNVPVSEIKRFNGLLTDTAIYGRDTLLIPTKLMPVGREVQMIFAQIAAGIGRDPVLNEEANLHPASAAAVRVARALHVAGDTPDSPSAAPWWCQCGTCMEDEHESSTCKSRRMSDYGSEPGEVELMIRSRNNSGLPGPPSGSGPTRLHEQMHRRTRRSGHGSEGEECAQQQAGPGGRRPSGRHLSRGGPADGDPSWLTSHTGGGGLLAVISKAIEESSLMQKIKAAATQPALAKPAANLSFADAADGVMSSLRQGLLPKGGVGGGVRRPTTSNGGAGGDALPCSFAAPSVAPTPMKCGKSD